MYTFTFWNMNTSYFYTIFTVIPINLNITWALNASLEMIHIIPYLTLTAAITAYEPYKNQNLKFIRKIWALRLRKTCYFILKIMSNVVKNISLTKNVSINRTVFTFYNVSMSRSVHEISMRTKVSPGLTKTGGFIFVEIFKLYLMNQKRYAIFVRFKTCQLYFLYHSIDYTVLRYFIAQNDHP